MLSNIPLISSFPKHRFLTAPWESTTSESLYQVTVKSLNNHPMPYSTSSAHHSLATPLPWMGLVVAQDLQHQVLPRGGAHLCPGCYYLPLCTKTYELPTSKHVPPPLPKPARAVSETVGSKARQPQLVEKTMWRILFDHCQLWRERLALTKRQNVLRAKMFQPPLVSVNLPLHFPPGKPNQGTPNFPPKRES